MKSLINDIEIGGVKDALDILDKAGGEDLFEKAKHQIGDSHPKWPQLKWTDLGGGKFGWRTGTGRGKRASTGGNAAAGSGAPKQLTANGDSITKVINKITSASKNTKNPEDMSLDELNAELTEINNNISNTKKLINKLEKEGKDGQASRRKLYVKTKYEERKYIQEYIDKLKSSESKKNKLTPKQQKIVDGFMDKVKTSDSRYSDPSKVTLWKTPKGNWYVKYDGHQVATIAPSGLTEKIAEAAGMKIDREPSSYQSSKTSVTNKTAQKKLRPVGTGTNGPERRTKESQERIDKKKSTQTKKKNAIKAPKGWKQQDDDSISLDTKDKHTHVELHENGYSVVVANMGRDGWTSEGSKVFKTLDEAIKAGQKFIDGKISSTELYNDWNFD